MNAFKKVDHLKQEEQLIIFFEIDKKDLENGITAVSAGNHAIASILCCKYF